MTSSSDWGVLCRRKFFKSIQEFYHVTVRNEFQMHKGCVIEQGINGGPLICLLSKIVSTHLSRPHVLPREIIAIRG
jgi:hypothetical protein